VLEISSKTPPPTPGRTHKVFWMRTADQHRARNQFSFMRCRRSHRLSPVPLRVLCQQRGDPPGTLYPGSQRLRDQLLQGGIRSPPAITWLLAFLQSILPGKPDYYLLMFIHLHPLQRWRALGESSFTRCAWINQQRLSSDVFKFAPLR